MRSKVWPLFKLWYSPLQAMSELAGRSPYVSGALLAFAASFLYAIVLSGEFAASLDSLSAERGLGSPWLVVHLARRFTSSVTPLIFLTVIFTPACLFAANLLDRRSSFRVLLTQEFAPFVSAVLYSWASAHLIMLMAAGVAGLTSLWPSLGATGSQLMEVELALRILPLPYFAFLVTIAVKVVLRLGFARALVAVALSAISLLALPLVPRLLVFLTSPFLLIILFLVLRNLFGDLFSAHRAREQFKRSMEAATLNPADASAHYNLGLLYQQRGQFEEARNCFDRAIQIDPEETDAHYQLGRIAREQGDLPGAIAHFDEVVMRNPEHSLNEVWREIGRAYFQAGQFEDARTSFERFVQRRESDAEGRYYYGLTLYKLGRDHDGAEQMKACIEAVRTSPAYKYRSEKRWMNEAQAILRTNAAEGSSREEPAHR